MKVRSILDKCSAEEILDRKPSSICHAQHKSVFFPSLPPTVTLVIKDLTMSFSKRFQSLEVAD